MPGDGRTLTVRRTCDFAPVLQIDSDADPLCSYGDDVAPGFLAFSPQGDCHAVWWGGDVAMYRQEKD